MQSRRVGRRLELPQGPPESVALRSPWPLGQTNVKFGHDAGPRLSQRTDGGGAVIGFSEGPPTSPFYPISNTSSQVRTNKLL